VPEKPTNVRRIRNALTSRLPSVNERTWESKKIYTMTANCVCAKCNNGWMSAVEGRTKRFIEPMIEGTVVELDTEAQAAIATWACLRTVIGYYAHKTYKPHPSDWLEHIYKYQTPPDNWFIWTTAYDGNTPARFESSEIGLAPATPGNPERTEYDHGVVTSILIGYLALKVFGFRYGRTSEPGADAALRIWPSSPLIYIWPPPAYLENGLLNYFFDWGLTGAEQPPF
jgi:hypothetical protein